MSGWAVVLLPLAYLLITYFPYTSSLLLTALILE
jgi:hypothetical protein